jgi:hypothetical protein
MFIDTSFLKRRLCFAIIALVISQSQVYPEDGASILAAARQDAMARSTCPEGTSASGLTSGDWANSTAPRPWSVRARISVRFPSELDDAAVTRPRMRPISAPRGWRPGWRNWGDWGAGMLPGEVDSPPTLEAKFLYTLRSMRMEPGPPGYYGQHSEPAGTVGEAPLG